MMADLSYIAIVERNATNAAIVMRAPELSRETLPLVAALFFGAILNAGSYSAGAVLLTVPSQQKSAKHCVQTCGTAVFVLSMLLCKMAHPTQTDQVALRVPLPMVATL